MQFTFISGFLFYHCQEFHLKSWQFSLDLFYIQITFHRVLKTLLAELIEKSVDGDKSSSHPKLLLRRWDRPDAHLNVFKWMRLKLAAPRLLIIICLMVLYSQLVSSSSNLLHVLSMVLYSQLLSSSSDLLLSSICLCSLVNRYFCFMFFPRYDNWNKWSTRNFIKKSYLF